MNPNYQSGLQHSNRNTIRDQHAKHLQSKSIDLLQEYCKRLQADIQEKNVKETRLSVPTPYKLAKRVGSIPLMP